MYCMAADSEADRREAIAAAIVDAHLRRGEGPGLGKAHQLEGVQADVHAPCQGQIELSLGQALTPLEHRGGEQLAPEAEGAGQEVVDAAQRSRLSKWVLVASTPVLREGTRALARLRSRVR